MIRFWIWMGLFFLPTIVGYLIGSIPFSWILARMWAKIDIREYGSGNVGATNVWRVLGPFPGLVAFACDCGKGYLAVWLFGYAFEGGGWVPGLMARVAVATIIGHTWPVWLRFKGGKGVAVTAGIFLCLAPFALISTLVVFITVVILTRYISVGSMTGALTLPVIIYILKGLPDFRLETFYLSVAVALFVVYSHRTNIKRLLAGTENKISWKRK